MVAVDPLLDSRTLQLVELAARQTVPAIYNLREFVATGSLIARPGKAKGEARRDRSENQVRSPSLQKALTAIDRMRTLASNLTGPTLRRSPVSPELPPPPVTPAAPARIVTVLRSSGPWPR
jgi:hypothetical protein